jgi:predicted membrane protein
MRNRQRRERNPATQMIIGLFVIGVGMLFLLDNLGWLDLDLRIHIFPTILIGAGILKVLQTRTQSGVVVGGGLILAGCLFMLKAMGYLDIDWRTLWPLFMIAAGVAVVVKSNINRNAPAPDGLSLNKDSDDTVINATAIMGGFKRRITTQDFRGGEITAIMGGCELDLRQSGITGDAVLNVYALFGGITIKVPIDWTVVLEGTPIMGGFEEKTVPPASVAKRLIVRGYVIMGGLEVRN